MEKKKQEHDIGLNLVNEFVTFLVENGIRVEPIDRNHAKINDRLCFLKHNNASRKPPHEFGIYFWGIGKKAFEEMYSQRYEFFILIGGRNLGKKASSKISNQNNLSTEEKELIELARIEHVFIIPFEIFNQLIEGMPPAKNDQLKIHTYMNQDFGFNVSGMKGSKSKKISGDEIKTRYLNKFELLGIDTQKSTNIRTYLKLMEDKFNQYFAIFRRYRNILDRVIDVSYMVKEKDEVYADEVIPFEEEMKGVPDILKENEITHTGIEGLLIELGNFLGYDTYTVDSSKVYKDKTLGEIMELSTLPRFAEDRILDTAREIDVIWFENNFPVYVFEVEHTTDFAKGLQRMYQLRYFSTNYFLVATKDRKRKYETEIQKDPYFSIKDRSNFLSYEDLTELFNLVKECYNKGTEVGILWKD